MVSPFGIFKLGYRRSHCTFNCCQKKTALFLPCSLCFCLLFALRFDFDFDISCVQSTPIGFVKRDKCPKGKVGGERHETGGRRVLGAGADDVMLFTSVCVCLCVGMQILTACVRVCAFVCWNDNMFVICVLVFNIIG